MELNVVDIREFTEDRHRTVDDLPYGGGPGMVMKPGPIVRAAESLPGDFWRGDVLITSPRGRRFDQTRAERLAGGEYLTVICGRYKGVDGRVPEILGAEEVSIGDFVLSGGEIAALAIVESVARLLPGFMGDIDSAMKDSFSGRDRILSPPEYTRPRGFRGMRVPEQLLTGNHGLIEEWKRRQSLRITRERRPDLLAEAELSPEEVAYLQSIKPEDGD